MKNKMPFMLFLLFCSYSCWSPKELLYNNFINILTNCNTTDKVAGHMARIEWPVEKKRNRIRYYESKSYDGAYFGDYYEFYAGTSGKFYYCFSATASKRYDKFIKFISRNSIKGDFGKPKNCAIDEVYKMSNECYICNKNFKEANNGFLVIVSRNLDFKMPKMHSPPQNTNRVVVL